MCNIKITTRILKNIKLIHVRLEVHMPRPKHEIAHAQPKRFSTSKQLRSVLWMLGRKGGEIGERPPMDRGGPQRGRQAAELPPRGRRRTGGCRPKRPRDPNGTQMEGPKTKMEGPKRTAGAGTQTGPKWDPNGTQMGPKKMKGSSLLFVHTAILGARLLWQRFRSH